MMFRSLSSYILVTAVESCREQDMARLAVTTGIVMAAEASTVVLWHDAKGILGNLSNVLDQLNLPFNMVLSLIFLNTKYKRCHLLGATLVLYGGFVNMLPLFTGGSTLNMPDPTIGWILLFISSLLPAAASNVYKEIALKDVDLDIWYCNAWTSLYQVFLGLLTIWTIRVPALCDPPIDWQDFPEFIGISHQCFLGYPVEFQGKTLPCDEGVFELFMWFILFNMIFSQLMLYIFKEGSSVLFVVSSAVCLPLTDILYMFPLLTGAQATQTFTIYDGFALFVLVVHNSTVYVQVLSITNMAMCIF
ncbi:hypothetical protein DYB26_015131 [Aphanomyces astaci]|uniref:Uncharacterized protein n=1 Tax=Aphanomyces astaci TaxID=112090 RepID=A0A418G3Q9_APHAT|nr:hypothetical protein DYB26_015131 [Aphanomyces astaci]